MVSFHIFKKMFFTGVMGTYVLVGMSGPANSAPKEMAVLQGLEKVTARVSTFEVPLNMSHRFGSLDIFVRSCDKTPPEEKPEATAFLEIYDQKIGEEPVSIFTGWMFSSSPAVSAIEHPVYDVWVLDCIDTPNQKSQQVSE